MRAALCATLLCLGIVTDGMCRQVDPVAYFEFEQKTPEGKIERFVFKLTDATRIAEARHILADTTETRRHVEGRIVKMKTPFNPRWSFNLDPPTITFFAAAIEVCDANVAFVEAHLGDVGGSMLPGSFWCPWSSRLTAEVMSLIDPETEHPRNHSRDVSN